MAEFLTMEDAENKFGSKSKANAGLTLGIIGTALAGLGGGLGNIFGGNSSTAGDYPAGSCGNPYVCKDTFWQQNIDLQKEIGRIDYDALKHNYELYVNLDSKINDIACSNAQLQATLPLAMQLAAVNAERYADNKLNTYATEQTAFNFMVQNQLGQKINGTMGLPWGDIITGIPTMPACTMGVTCPTTTTTAS